MADTTVTEIPRQLRLRNMAVLGVVALVVLSIAVWAYYRGRETTDDAQVDGHVVPTASRVPGTVAAVHVSDNQAVKAGDLLVELDPRDYQLALDRAQADFAEATSAAREAGTAVPVASAATASSLSGARAGVERARAGILAAQAALDAAHARRTAVDARLRESAANEKKAVQDFARLEPLLAKDEVSRQQYDAAAAAAEAARAGAASARASVAEAEHGVAVAQSQLTQAQTGLTTANAAAQAAATGPEQVAGIRARASSADARVDRARAALEQARLNLEYTKIKASRAGMISRKSVDVGQIVQAGQPLLAIVPLDDVWVTANFKETQLEDMRPGQRARIKVDAYGGQVFEGKVQSIAAATGARFSLLPPENATGNYVKVVQRVPVKIVLDANDPQHLLRPGMSVGATVFTK